MAVQPGWFRTWSEIQIVCFVPKLFQVLLQVKGVLVGYDPLLSYWKMLKASSYAMNPDNVFIATNVDSFYPGSAEKVVLPGTAGSFGNFLEKTCFCHQLLAKTKCSSAGSFVSYMHKKQNGVTSLSLLNMRFCKPCTWYRLCGKMVNIATAKSK